MKNIILVGMVSILMSGCATKYSCGQYPTSGCQPVSTVYDRTNEGFHDYRKTLFQDEESSSVNSHVHVGEAHRTLNYSVPGDPLLSKPTTLRILFDTWLDSDKDLNGGGFVYIRLRESEWLINK